MIAFQGAVWWLPYPQGELAPPGSSTWISDRDGNALAAFVDARAEWSLPLTMDQISPHLLDAIVAVEDQRFYQHGGVDWKSAAFAGWQDLVSLHFRRGASTITMQLEHLRQPAGRSILGKLAQAVRACQIERVESKQQIVVEYLNRAPFGGNLTGAGAASWRYFGRPCRQLSLGQAALLAGLPQSPNRLRPDRWPARAAARRDHVLARMLACGMITEVEKKLAMAEPVNAGWRALPQDDPRDAGLLPTLVRLDREHPGQMIRTTISQSVQRQAAGAVEDQMKVLAASHITAATVVVLDTSTGECLASVSRSMDAGHSSADVDLTMRPRSSGSTLKPLIYAAAFDAGICTPSTPVEDSAVAWAGYEPSNYDREFAGWMPAAEALAQSRNVPALVLLSKLHVENAVELMRACGLATLSRTPDRYGLSLVIGGAEVTPMELAEAYATMGRGGVHRGVRELAAEAASPVLEREILRRSSCLQALQCIADPERTRRVCAEAGDLAPAWKTGTSSGHRDAWCAAVTPRRTVVVWLGNTDGSGSDALIGQDAAAPLALRIITAVDAVHGEVASFAPPADFLAANLLTRARPAAARMESPQIAMLSPVDGEKIVADVSLPSDQRRVALRARLLNPSSEDGQLWWMIDSQCLGVCQSGEVMWWDPTPGPHEVRVVNAAGQSATANVDVMR
jgi:penicillin-binding protein 1C